MLILWLKEGMKSKKELLFEKLWTDEQIAREEEYLDREQESIASDFFASAINTF